MTTQSLSSTDLVKQIDEETLALVRAARERDILPHLAVVVLGNNDRYAKLKQRRGHALGLTVSIYRLPATTRFEDIISVIGFLNTDSSVHGIIIQLPLPRRWSAAQIDAVINAVAIDKDVDGLHPNNKIWAPTTATAMLRLLKSQNIDLDHALVVGRGRLVGQPLDRLLTAQNIPHEVTDKDSAKRDKAIASADVILAGTDSKVPIFSRRTVKEGVVIAAAGLEINHDDLDGWAEALTPEKGGIGPLTVSLLMQQTAQAANQS